MAIIVTGAAGFIGMHVCLALLEQGREVIGIDNLNDYYDPALKHARLAQCRTKAGFHFHENDISDREAMHAIFNAHSETVTGVIHLAAQAGVRYSLIDPYTYVNSNVMGQVVLLEASRKLKNLQHFVYASSSSVYGGNTKLPFAIEDPVDKPVSLYAATKRACELISNTYRGLYQIPQTGLRFFTVYGPWGRPDMAAYIFTDSIYAGKPIRVFNHGKMQRDFTYIDDITAGVLAALDRVPEPEDGHPVGHKIYNLGNHKAETLMDFIHTLENAIGRKAVMQFEDIQKGDVPATFADIEASQQDLKFNPVTPIAEGIPRFVSWYREFHKLSA